MPRLPALAVLVACLALAALPARAEERLLGILPVPDATDVRTQVIERQPTEAWPFVPERGLLICVPSIIEPFVYFANDARRGEELSLVTLGIDPFLAVLEPVAQRKLVRPYDDFMERAEAIAPFYWMGRRLCEQKKGSTIGPGEL